MLDFAVFDSKTPANEGAWLHVKLPNGDPAYLDNTAKNPKKPVRIKLLGLMSDKSRASIRNQRTEKRIDDNPETIAALDLENAKYIASLTVAWENVAVDGKELEFNQENAEMVYFKFNQIYHQAHRFYLDTENFTHSSVKS